MVLIDIIVAVVIVIAVVVAVVVVAEARERGDGIGVKTHIGQREEAGGRIETLHQKLKLFNNFTSSSHKPVSVAACRNYASWTLEEASVEETCSAKWPENWWLLPAFQNRQYERTRKERGASK